MPWGLSYELVWNAVPPNDELEGTQVSILIFDNETYSPTPIDENIISLQGGESPLKISIVNDEEDKFSTIRAKQAVIQFISTATENSSLFSQGDDNRWYVKILVSSAVSEIFEGYLLQDEIEEDFLDSDIGNVVTLTATDNIGLLKDIPLTDFSGVNPKGKFRIIEFITWALSKTVITKPVNVVNSLFEENNPGVPCYESTYLDAKTFEKDINISEDCYTVLQKILGEQAFLTQRRGEWWIVRTDEQERDTYYVHRFDTDASFLTTSEQELIQEIGLDEEIEFSQAETYLFHQRAVKSVTEVYKYEYPKELIDNIHFDRGTWISPVVVSYAAPFTSAKAFTVEDWTFYRGTFNSPLTPIGYYYIIRKYTGTVEGESYLRISPGISGDFHWLKSNPVPLGNKDKIKFSFDFRFQPDGGTYTSLDLVQQFIFVGDSGTIYSVDGTFSIITGYDLEWQVYDGTQRIHFTVQNVETDLEYWISTTTGDALPPLPEDGFMYFHLNAFGFTNKYIEYKNLSLEYTPYINGSYQKYTGQHHKVEQTGSRKAKHEADIFISDSPKKLFKGALYRKDGSNYPLAGRFYSGAVFPGFTLPSDENLHPFGHMQVMDVWNQKSRAMRVFDFKSQGLRLETDLPDITDQIKLLAVSSHTTNKRFQVLHMEQDLDLCEMSGVLAEVMDDVLGKEYPDPHEFKYLTE